MTIHAIPTYALYGEAEGDPGADWLHCETIQSRSSLHGYRIESHRHETLFQILHLRSGRAELVVDGQSRARNVVIEFPDYETAMACYHSPEYQENIKVRQAHSIAELIIVEGYDGP